MVEAMNATSDKRKRTRSPAYPYINLEAAIKRAKVFYDEEGQNAANIKVAVKHWGYEEKSSSGMQVIAALISFGLLKDEGTSDKRKVQLTQIARRILLDNDPNSKERAEAIKKAALSPKIHHDLWKKWGSTHPSELSMRNVLTLEWEPPFNDKAVDVFIKEYKDTIAFAKLGYTDTLPDNTADKEDHIEESFEQQRPNLMVSESVHQAWPEVPLSPPSRTTAGMMTQRVNIREDIFSLAEGTVTFRWPTPLSAESIEDLKDWLKILERKLARSLTDISVKDQSGYKNSETEE